MYATLDFGEKEFYVKSYYSAVYKSAKYSNGVTFKKGDTVLSGNTLSRYSRTIVNAKDGGCKDSNGNNEYKDDETVYLHTFVDASQASIGGTEITITVEHPEFANRTKENKLTLFRKVNYQTFSVIERHEKQLTLKDATGDSIPADDLASNYTLISIGDYTLDSSDNSRTDNDNIYKPDGNEYTLNYGNTNPNYKKQEINKKGNNKYLAQVTFGTGNQTSNQTLLGRLISVFSNTSTPAEPLSVIARTYMSSGTNDTPCTLKFKHTKTGKEFNVDVTTIPFKAKLYGVYYDNLGFAEKGKEIFVEQNSFFRGDKIAISSNSDELSVNFDKNTRFIYTPTGENDICDVSVKIKDLTENLSRSETGAITVVDKSEDEPFNKKSEKELTYYTTEIKNKLDTKLEFINIITNSGVSLPTVDQYLLYKADKLKVSYILSDEGVAKDFWKKEVFKKSSGEYNKENITTKVDDELQICTEAYSSILNRLWLYNNTLDLHGSANNNGAGLGASIWNITNQIGNSYFTTVRSTNVTNNSPGNNRAPYVYAVNKDEMHGDMVGTIGGYSITAYDYLNLGSVPGPARVLYAGRQIATYDGGYTGDVNYGLPNKFAIAPVGNNTNVSNYVKAVKSSSEQLKNTDNVLAKGIVARNNELPDRASITSPIQLANSTDERVMCALSWSEQFKSANTQTDIATGQKAKGGAIETAIANFGDAAGGDGSNMIYLHIPLKNNDGVAVTYKVWNNNGSEDTRIICTNSKQNKKFTEEYANNSVIFTKESNNTCISAGSAIECKNMSANELDDSVLAIGNLGAFFPDNTKIVNGTGQRTTKTEDAADCSDWTVIRLNAKKLGWLKPDVKYVDVDVTVILSDFGFRQVTFPYRFLNNAHQ